jgi:tetratricopeptide (TPR) repeat protein
MKTKENAFTLPLVIALYEYLFFEGTVKKRVFFILPFLFTMSIIPLTLVDIEGPPDEVVRGMLPAVIGHTDLRWEYLFTQFRVIITYFRLLFLPINQNVDYDYPVYHDLLDPHVLSSAALVFAFFVMALYFLRQSCRGNRELRLVSFGMLWFLITLSVESSIVPIPMLINEYRLYLPSAGFFTAAVTGAFMGVGTRGGGREWKAVIAALSVASVVFALCAYSRNNVWLGEERLWEDTLKKSPGKSRVHNNLGIVHFERGEVAEAIKYYTGALDLSPGDSGVHNNLGNSYMAEGLLDRAISHFNRALKGGPSVEVHFNLANAHAAKGEFDKSIVQYLNALRLNPDDSEAHYNLGFVYERKGLLDRAIEHYRESLELMPEFVGAYNNLGINYLKKGDYEKAMEYLNKAIELDPEYANAYFNRGRVHEALGEPELAERDYERAYSLGYGGDEGTEG